MADPLWINRDAVTGLPELSANELRQAMAMALQYGGRPLGARQGVRPGGNQLQVSLNGSVITVQPGLCCIDPGLTTPQGPYWVAIPAIENPGPVAAADATYARKDIIIARVYDHDEDGSGLRLARSEYLAGVAAAAPIRPNLPAGAFRVATIDVPKAGGGAAVVTNEYPFTVAAGGLLPVRNQAERDVISPVAYDGMAIWRMDRDWIEVYDGAAWRVQGIAKVASAADRAAITNPYDGQVIARTDRDWREQYDGTVWRIGGGQKLYARTWSGAANFVAGVANGATATVFTTSAITIEPGQAYEIDWLFLLANTSGVSGQGWTTLYASVGGGAFTQVSWSGHTPFNVLNGRWQMGRKFTWKAGAADTSVTFRFDAGCNGSIWDVPQPDAHVVVTATGRLSSEVL